MKHESYRESDLFLPCECRRYNPDSRWYRNGDTAAHHELTLAQVKRLCKRHHLKIERCEDFDGPDYPYLAMYTVVEPREFDRAVWSIIRAVRDSFEMVVEKRYEKLLSNKRKKE